MPQLIPDTAAGGGSSWKKADLVFLASCAIFLYLHLFVPPVTPIFYEEDHLMFIADAWRMYMGEAIYKDFFQLTFPGTQTVYLALLSIFGTSFWLVNAVIFAQGIAHVLIWMAISKRFFEGSWVAYLPASVFMFFGFRWFGLDGSHRMLSPIFIGLGILVLLKFSGYGRLIMAGGCCAIATFFTQQRGMIVIAAIAIFLIIENRRNRVDLKRLLIEEALLGSSFAIAVILLLLPFIVPAGPGRFIDDTFFFLQHYIQGSVSDNYSAFFNSLKAVFEQGILVSIVAGFYYALIPLVYIVSFWYLWKRHYDSGALLIALIGFSLAFGAVVPVPGRMFQIAFPAVVVFVWLLAQTRALTNRAAKYVVIVLVTFGLALGVRVQMNWQQYSLDSPTGTIVFLSPVAFERYMWLSENTQPGDFIFEVYQPAVNFPLQVRNPTAVTLLWDNAFTPQSQVLEAIDGLEKHEARYIIWDANWSKESSSRSLDDKLEPLYQYLQQNYEIDKTFTPYSTRRMQVWRRK